MWKVCWSKGRLYCKIAKLFHFCHLSKLVRPETYGPYHVSHSFSENLKPASPCHYNIVGIFECKIVNAICGLKTQQLLLLHLIPLHLSPTFHWITLPLLVHKEKRMSCYVSKISMMSKEKVTCTIIEALRLCTGRTAHKGSRGIALLFLDHGTRRGWGVSFMPWPLFTPVKDPLSIVQEAGWAPGPVSTGVEYLSPTGIRSPDRPARSQSLYQLHYLAHTVMSSTVETKILTVV